jgi:hypothetical protein
MLRCNIALAASGANSQLSGSGRGGISELESSASIYRVDIPRFSSLAWLLLR